MIDKGLIDKLSIEMKEILEKELETGNEIAYTLSTPHYVK